MIQCDECLAGAAPAHYHARRALPLQPSSALTLTPFVLTFFAVGLFAWQKLFPLLTAGGSGKTAADSHTRKQPIAVPRASIKAWARFAWERVAAITFATTIALSALLAELIFCEISDTFDPAARKFALDTTIWTLLVSLVVITPALEIHSLTSAAGFGDAGTTKLIFGILLDATGLAGWLAAFWAIGQAALGSDHHLQDATAGLSIWNLDARLFKLEFAGHGLSQGSLERIGIIGISLMAALAGFAAVSSIWQTFGSRVRKVTEADIARKQAGLEATGDLLLVKESRLRALERKLSHAPQASYMTRLFRPNADNQELQSLKLEISGLTTMQAALSNSLNLLRARHATQRQASTALGRICITTSYVFSLYCLYRIFATTLAMLRRWRSPRTTFASTDPITNALALAAKLWDPTLDRAAWSRQISFLLSGLMLLASFNAVLQTVLLFSRFTPARLLQSAQQNLALLVSQICATYVVSSALLLRSNLPREMGGVIEEALGAPLDVKFVEVWFESWFLGTCVVTAVGIWVSRNVVGTGELDDDYFDDDGGDMEAGKRNS